MSQSFVYLMLIEDHLMVFDVIEARIMGLKVLGSGFKFRVVCQNIGFNISWWQRVTFCKMVTWLEPWLKFHVNLCLYKTNS